MTKLKRYYKWIGFALLVVIILQNINLEKLTETLLKRNYFKHFSITALFRGGHFDDKNITRRNSTSKQQYEKYSIYKIGRSPKHQRPLSNESPYFTEADFQEFCSQPPVLDLMFSCRDHLSWTDRLQNSSHLRTQANSSLFQFFIYQRTTRAAEGMTVRDFVGYIKIQTFNRRGIKKNTGGDWWRGSVIGGDKQNSLRWSVRIVDRNDGSYIGVFPIRFSGEFRLEIYLEYSLCEGILDPPFDWFSKG